MKHLEHTLQRNMVNLFRMAYPQYKGVFFAVPNGGHRDIRVAQHMKAEGQLAGVSDLLLLVARKGMHGLCIEVKTKTGRQSERQKARITPPQWQKDLARWADRKEIFKTTDFKDYEPRKGFKCKEYFKV